jgi:hypothetical protein
MLLLLFQGGTPLNDLNPLLDAPVVAAGDPSGSGLDFIVNAVNRNDKVRFVDGFDVSYNLHGRAIARFKTVDAHDDPALAYRPVNGEEVSVTTVT